DLNIETYNTLLEDEAPQNLLKIESKINEHVLIISSDYEISDDSGSESKLLLKLYNDLEMSEVIEECEVVYTNGDAELHEDEQYYVPLVENDFYTSESEVFLQALIDHIDEHLPYLVDEVDEEKVKEIAEGGLNPVSSSECEECGEEYVSVNDEIAPIGICVKCGFKNELKECARCYSLYNTNIEGSGSFCGSCNEYVKEYYD
ncbi:MAG: hypothetical protein ACK411_14675, partial [Exiguobacterium mexicanum]